MKIWKVTGYDNGVSTYFEPTLDKAVARKREMKADKVVTNVAGDLKPREWHNITIEPYRVEPTKAGIADALNGVLDVLCANEY